MAVALIRTDKLLSRIETALRRPPGPDADMDQRARLICAEISRLRQAAGEADDIDLRLYAGPEISDEDPPALM